MDRLTSIREFAYALAGSDKATFIESFIKIEDKNAPGIVVPFTLWEAQKAALLSLESHRLNVILKARQLGISWLALSYALCVMISVRGSTVIGMSRTEDEAKELVRRLQVILNNMPALFSPDNAVREGMPYFTRKALELAIYWPSGAISIFKAFPSAASAGRSFTANLIIFDEWAFQQFAQEIWTAGFPTINRPTGGQVIGLSTIERGSFFEDVFVGAPDNGFNPIFLPWHADPRRDLAWYEGTKQALGDLIMQEYPATVEEALTVPGGAFFPEVKGHIHIKPPMDKLEMVRRYVCIDYGLDGFSAHWVWLNGDNHARVYREYDAEDMRIFEAAEMIVKLSRGEKIDGYLAPPDLWSRSQESGKSRADIFAENGVYLTKTSNDLAAGCAALKEWLRPFEVSEDEKGNVGMAGLTLDEGAAPNLFRCLTKIQKDPLRPDIYAKNPHYLTHDVDSLRCFAVYWTSPLKAAKKAPRIDFEFQRKSAGQRDTAIGEVPSESFINY